METHLFQAITALRDGTRCRDCQIMDTIELLSMDLPLVIDLAWLGDKWKVNTPQLMNRLGNVNALGIVEITKVGKKLVASNSGSKSAPIPANLTSVYDSKSWSELTVAKNLVCGVPQFRQRDSVQAAQRHRTCFSSSCAMLLEAIKPGTLDGLNGDDQYLTVVQRFGDTTDASAQLRALAHYGVTARLVQNADFRLIERQIARGIPVPCGYIHRGPVERPTGSGHWLIVYGHTPTHVLVNDPWGEPDLIRGTTLNADGMGLRFSRLNFGKRWMVEPIGSGAYRYAPGRGWAVVVG